MSERRAVYADLAARSKFTASEEPVSDSRAELKEWMGEPAVVKEYDETSRISESAMAMSNMFSEAEFGVEFG